MNFIYQNFFLLNKFLNISFSIIFLYSISINFLKSLNDSSFFSFKCFAFLISFINVLDKSSKILILISFLKDFFKYIR